MVIGAIAGIFGVMKILEDYEKKEEVKVEEPKIEGPIGELAPKTQINYVPEVTEDWNNKKKEQRRRRRKKLVEAIDGKVSEKFSKLEEKIYEMWIPEKITRRSERSENVSPYDAPVKNSAEVLQELMDAPEVLLDAENQESDR